MGREEERREGWREGEKTSRGVLCKEEVCIAIVYQIFLAELVN